LRGFSGRASSLDILQFTRIIATMRRTFTIMLFGVASFATVYLLAPRQAPQPSDFEPEPVAVTGSVPSVSEAVTFELRPTAPVELALAHESLPAPIRNVTPPNLTAPPPVTGPLTRVEPVAKEAAPNPPRRERLFAPIVIEPGVIKVGDREITFAGVEAPDTEATCGDGAAAWPCGRMARAALRRFIRNRAVECEAAGDSGAADSAICFVAGQNISEWLVAQGWAKDAGGYDAAQAKAREVRLGVWSERRPDAQPALAAREAESAPDNALAISARVSSTP
jgi:endonuclease YncB( thermonuclease family)